ncbi:hypothetical protein C5167_028232 [Papaver somniferum]|nr:hypothetical protein C5167_028232 [Papaver somniferum]
MDIINNMDIRSSQKARQSKVVQQRQKVCPYTLYLYYVFSQLRKVSLVNVFVSDMAKSREEVTKLEKYRELAAHQIFRICCKERLSVKHWMENRLQRKKVFRVPNSDSSIKSFVVVVHSYQLPPLNGKHAFHQNWIGIAPCL